MKSGPAPEYAGLVHVEGRLLGFDILGSTLVTLVEQSLDKWALDWYDIGSVLSGRIEE
ncbi:MAG: hypothetical protein OXQ32_08705 [bacterium]|nr:hypothetical protein [bacterium]MDE2875390.1 hypothetical protein [Gemmatimonadota bacterium]